MQQRQCVILSGDAKWCQASSQALLEDFDNNNIIALSNQSHNVLTLPQKQAQRHLGKEFDAVIFDALDDFNPDSFGAIVGTVKQGGAIIIYFDINKQPSLSMQRFMRVITEFEQQYEHFVTVQQSHANQWGQTRLISGDGSGSETKSIESDPIDFKTADQQKAVEAIKRVVHGHRRRPLVLSADRGRGKSASLGIAAAHLLNEGKQTILLTAPSLATVDTVFEHASRLLADAESSAGLISVNDAEIRFVAPDVLIESDLKADLVLVDEAAAIPAAMLEKLLQKYSRIVFSTTLHGYEGTGRGFAVRFQKTLDEKTPNWHHYRMEAPIRWSKNDMLEAFSFESLLLNALPVDDDLVRDASADLCHFECIDRHALIDNAQDLRELFGLMVLAHYRTRPSDLQMMLDRDDVSVYVMRYQGHIVASAWLVNEGELDDELSANIHAGHRRLKGHLLPQSLLAHVGITTAGSLNCRRIIRIATHPAIQQRGIGQNLLAQINSHLECDVVGTSFAASSELLDFWTRSGFSPVRLGFHHDDVSGGHSVMMLNALSEQGKTVANNAQQRFQQQWPQLLRHEFKQLDSELVIALCRVLGADHIELSQWDRQDINAFAYEQRGFEFSQFSLWLWLIEAISTEEFKPLSRQHQHLCVMAIMQQRAWTEIAKCLGFTGKVACITALRQAITSLLKERFI